MIDPLEKVNRPIVEGQIRGFLKEHASIVAAVDWYKPRKHDKATTFTNSLAKRIVRDLCCALSRDRIEDALFEIWETDRNSGVAIDPAPDGGNVGTFTDLPPQLDVESIAAANGGPHGIPGVRAASAFDDWFGN